MAGTGQSTAAGHGGASARRACACSTDRDERVLNVPLGAVSPYALSITKRVFDILLSAIGLVVSAPVWIAISLAIMVEDGLPVLYAQQRVGLNGRVHTLYKFRSMVRGAEAKTGPVLATKDDPRVTRVGRLLRATAMDELPQLVNIFLGHMSFVGPRPERPELVAEIEARCPEFACRHVVRPGLTGPAQVFGHYETDPAQKLVYDLEYIRTATFWGDVRLILSSFWITFTARWQERNGHVSRPARSANGRPSDRESGADAR